MRAFFALPVPDEAKPQLIAAQARMRAAAEGSRWRARWIVPEQMHVTLKFLGPVEEGSVPRLLELLESHAPAPIDAHIGPVIAFGGRKARAIVADVHADADVHVHADVRADADVHAHADPTDAPAPNEEASPDPLTALAAALQRAVIPLGIAPEKRRYHAHVTLARIKPPGNVKAWLEAAQLQPLAVRFDELRLYRSELTPQGGRYSVLGRVGLG